MGNGAGGQGQGAREPGGVGTARGAEAPAAPGHLGAGLCWRLLEVTGLLSLKKIKYYLAAQGLSCGMWDLYLLFFFFMWDL